MDDARLDRLLY